MSSAAKPSWQQLTALVSLSASGVVTGMSFVPKTADLTSPAHMNLNLLALQQTARPTAASNATLRSAIVNVSHYYLRLAQTRTPAEMQALIWRHDSVDGADHGQSCAAFASLMVELAAQTVGQQSWVSGGTSYPWPLHEWADVRVDPNAASPGIVSIRQDAQAHQRWHPLDDGYQVQPGDWVMFDNHVEVVTEYSAGTLSTIGGDSLPNFSVNAHQYRGSLTAAGVTGFVDNGSLPAAGTSAAGHNGPGTSQADTAAARGSSSPGGALETDARVPGAASGPRSPAPDHAVDVSSVASKNSADIPGTTGVGGMGSRAGHAARTHGPRRSRAAGRAGHTAATRRSGGAAHHQGPAQPDVPGARLTSVSASAAPRRGTAAIPGLAGRARQQSSGHQGDGSPGQPGKNASRDRTGQAGSAGSGGISTGGPRNGGGGTGGSGSGGPASQIASQQAFINAVAPGAVATQHEYGVPAAVTIAQAIEESAWGQSKLATHDHNLFGIKGTGPAGSDTMPTQEYEHGRLVTVLAPFRVYHDIAESISDHGALIATSGYYGQAMSVRDDPDSFANALTGVYSTDAGYGAKLIAIMRTFGLYHYGAGTATAPAAASTSGAASASARPEASPARSGHGSGSGKVPGGAAIPGLAGAAQPGPPVHRPRPAARPASPAVPGVQTEASSRIPQARTATLTVAAKRVPDWATQAQRRAQSRRGQVRAPVYRTAFPAPVAATLDAYATPALRQDEHLYRNIASEADLPWEVLAACDWMQCQARPRYSPVNGERLGTVNPDGTVYRTRSAALSQCAEDLVELAHAVYRIDLTAPDLLSVRDLAEVFAAFRWGQLLRAHRTSAMEFPYSVAGLTARQLHMRWPAIDEPRCPDRPGTRFRPQFGAVPVVLSLDYPATV